MASPLHLELGILRTTYDERRTTLDVIFLHRSEILFS